MNKILAVAFLVVALLVIPTTGFSATYLVPDHYPTIQAALTAVPSGNTVIVRSGVYTGASNKNLDFGGKGIALSAEVPLSVIIDCQNSGVGFYFDDGETNSASVPRR